MCFDRNINGNRDVKFLDCEYLLVQLSMKLTLAKSVYIVYPWLEDLTTSTTLFCVVSYKLSADRNKVLQQCTDKLYSTVVGDIQ